MTWRFEVRPAPGHPDPIATAALETLRGIGLSDRITVSGARLFFITMAGGPEAARRIGRELLADPVTEEAAWLPEGCAVPPPEDGAAVEVHYRPGVMDPAAASTALAIRDMGIEVTAVRTARRFVFRPAPDPATLGVIRRQLANDCIEEAIVGAAPIGPHPCPPEHRFEVRRVALGGLDDAGLQRLSREGHLFLSLEEMRAVRAEFARLGRDPTDLELETLAQTWSEHCVHKTLKSAIVYRGAPMPPVDGAAGPVERRYGNLLRDTIVRAMRELTAAGRGPECLSVFEDNAGVIAFDERFGIAFKVETHNHPSAIEPYGGAATGLGGCIRDVLGCGLGAKPIASTDVFCLAPPDWPGDAVPRGALHPRMVLRGVVAGVRDYGNRMGIPTVNGAIHFEPRFLGNPLVFCGCAGLIPRDRIRKAARPGDAIVLIGGRTGRDGIHGATFSSAELSGGHSDEFSHAVQIGNAIEEKKLLDVILEARDAEAGCLFSAITDCGAGGLSSAVGEMGAKIGAEVDLDRVPLKYAGLRYDEIWISEAQERMVLAVPEENVAAFLELCRAEDVEASVIGRFTDARRIVVRYRGTVVGDLDCGFLHDGPPRTTRQAKWTLAPLHADAATTDRAESPQRMIDALLRRLSDPTVASKEWVIRQYDHEVQGRSVVKPLVGPRADGPGDAAVLRPRFESDRGIALGCGLCPQVSDADPYWMALAAVDEAIRNVVCVGGDPEQTALLDNFCWGRTDDPAALGGLVRACQGCCDAALAYGTPFISGKDSLNNEFALDPTDAAAVRAAAARNSTVAPIADGRIRIPGTLLISAVALIDDVNRCITMDLKNGAPIFLIGRPTRFAGLDAGDLPLFDADEAAGVHRLVARLIRAGLIVAAHDAADGGPIVACAEMCIAGGRGCRILPTANGRVRWSPADLLRESPAIYLVQPAAGRVDEFLRAASEAAVTLLATVGPADDDARLEIEWPAAGTASVSLADLRRAWLSPLRNP